MTTQLLRGKRLRVTRLDECCQPPAVGDPCAVVTTKGFISLTMSPEYETGDEFIQKNADGDLCVNESAEDELKRLTVGIELCGVDFAVLELLTGDALEVDDDGNPVGIRSATGKNSARFALEVWTGVGGADACGSGEASYGYFLLPCVAGGKVGEVTIENAAINISVENAYTQGGGGWGVGPFDVIKAAGSPSPLLVPIAAEEHRLARLTTVAPPPPVEGCQTMYGGTPGDLSDAFTTAAALADLQTLKADSVSGDTGTGQPHNDGTDPYPAFPKGYYIVLADDAQVHWDGSAWVDGVAP